MNRSMLQTALAVGCVILANHVAHGEDAAVDVQAGQRKAQPCLSCHTLDSFARFEAAQLLAAIGAVAAGEAAHIPLPLSLTEADIADIAAYISAANAADE